MVKRSLSFSLGLSVVVVKDKRIVYSDTFGYNPDYSNLSKKNAIKQFLKEKKGSTMVDVFGIEDANFTDANYYKPKNIPAIGYYLKEEDTNDNQISIDFGDMFETTSNNIN